MAINIDSIMKKLNAYVKSSASQTVTKEYIADCIARGIRLKGGMSGSGKPGALVTVVEMEEAAKILITSVQNQARSFGLDGSITTLMDSLTYSAPAKQADGSYEVTIYFAGDKHRESLYPKGYPEGIDNIIALLNNGFQIGADKKQAFGMWHDQMTRGLRSREGLHFIQEAVFEFNAVFGDKYNATVWVDPVYEE